MFFYPDESYGCGLPVSSDRARCRKYLALCATNPGYYSTVTARNTVRVVERGKLKLSEPTIEGVQPLELENLPLDRIDDE